MQGYTPEWAEPITGLPAEQIREVARLYATADAACMLPGNGFDQVVASNHAVRAVAILMAITGNIDRPGGNLAAAGPPPPLKPVLPREILTQQMVDELVAPELPQPLQPFLEGVSSAYYKVLDAVVTEDPYPIKTIMAPGTQPTVITRGPRRVIEALEELEFFVVIDVMETAAMPWADIVIPVATMYESDSPFEARPTGEGLWLMARNKVVEPLGDYRTDHELWLDLACRMGYGEHFWHGDIEACMDWQLEGLGVTMEELRKHPAGIVLKPKPSDVREVRADVLHAQLPALRSAEPAAGQGGRSTTPPTRSSASARCPSGWSRPRAPRPRRSCSSATPSRCSTRTPPPSTTTAGSTTSRHCGRCSRTRGSTSIPTRPASAGSRTATGSSSNRRTAS